LDFRKSLIQAAIKFVDSADVGAASDGAAEFRELRFQFPSKRRVLREQSRFGQFEAVQVGVHGLLIGFLFLALLMKIYGFPEIGAGRH
jgi:hypothetical protein